MASVPIDLHVLPSADWNASICVPVRTRRTQPGGVPAGPAVFSLRPPVSGLRWIAYPEAADASANACRELAFKLSRIITPVFDQLLAPERERTCAMTSTSPLIGW